MCVAAPSALIADISAAGPLPDNTMWAGLLALGLFAVLVAVEKAVSIYSKTRKPIPDHELYATKAELNKLEASFSSDIDDVKNQMTLGFQQLGGRLGQMESTLSHLTNDMSYALGRLEGQITARFPVIPKDEAHSHPHD